MKVDIVLRWIEKAEHDLKTVEYLLVIEDAPTDIMCFHCQQAVEKYLKAYLTWVDIRVKKTHDIASILNLCLNNDREFEKLDGDKISRLTLYAVEIRYPEECLEADIDEVKEYYELANEVKVFVIERLNEKGLIT